MAIIRNDFYSRSLSRTIQMGLSLGQKFLVVKTSNKNISLPCPPQHKKQTVLHVTSFTLKLLLNDWCHYNVYGLPMTVS